MTVLLAATRRDRGGHVAGARRSGCGTWHYVGVLPVWVFACVSVVLGYLAHGLTMGQAPLLGAVAPAMTIALLVGRWARSQGWSLRALIVAVQLVQICCHVLFAVTSPMQMMAPHGYVNGNVMMIGHCLAGFTVALLLRRGELMLAASRRFVGRRALASFRPSPVPGVARVSISARGSHPVSAASLPGPLPGRAPPVRTAVIFAR